MDVLATGALGLLLLAAGAAALFMSPFLVMATDSAGEKAKVGLMGWAFAVTWGGAAIGVLGAIAGVIWAARHHGPMWVWPAVGIAVVGVSFALGALLATRVAKAPKDS